jgi:hypothetical protein
VVAGTLSAAGVLPTPRVNSTPWWLWRVPWLLMLSAVLAVLVAIFSRIELRHRRRAEGTGAPRPAVVRLSLTIGGLVAVVVGLLVNNLTSRFAHERFGIPLVALVAYLAGASLLRLMRAVGAKARSPVG